MNTSLLHGSFNKRRKYDLAAGFTLVELMAALAVAAIILTMAVPSFSAMMERNRLKAAANALYEDIRFARTMAIKNNKTIFVSVTTGDNWCYGLSDAGVCNCGTADSCKVDGVDRVLSGSEFSGITMPTSSVTIAGGTSFAFEPRRGVAQDSAGVWRNGALALSSSSGESIQTAVSSVGRVSQCSSNVGGYPTSC